MKFYINEYKGKFAMHCKTEEEAIDFCNFLHSIGRIWNNGEFYKHVNNFNDLEKNSVYVFNEGTYSSLIYAKTVGYKILEWEDYMEKKFTKAQLKDGMVVEFDDGERMMVMNDKLMSNKHFHNLHYFTDELEHICLNHKIVKVYTSEATIIDNYFESNNLTLIWKKSKEDFVREVTISEIEKQLGCKIKIINEEN